MLLSAMAYCRNLSVTREHSYVNMASSPSPSRFYPLSSPTPSRSPSHFYPTPNVYRIPTKVGTEIRLNELLSVLNFSPIRARIRVLWRILRSVRNEEVEEEKNEEIKTKFCSLVSRKWLERFSLNLVCRLPELADTSVANLVPIGEESIELHRCENCVFFLPVNILTGGTPASWAARHTTVCLD